MIKAVILDIDGVILGHEEGLTFPFPTDLVQKRLQNLSMTTAISLCTVKAYFAVEPIIKACGIEKNFHITDAGATLVQGATLETTTTTIDQQQAKKLINELRLSDIYIEWYAGNDYYALEHENSLIRDGRTKLLGREATITNDVSISNISKIIAFPLNELQTVELIAVSKKYSDFVSLHWGINPSLIPKTNAFLTHPTATKRSGVEKIAQLTGISLTETLAVGDSTNDWTFMELCGYKATLDNGTPELKELVLNQGDHGFVTEKNVEQNGIIEIFEHFNL